VTGSDRGLLSVEPSKFFIGHYRLERFSGGLGNGTTGGCVCGVFLAVGTGRGIDNSAGAGLPMPGIRLRELTLSTGAELLSSAVLP
jgi:hypothetical protein